MLFEIKRPAFDIFSDMVDILISCDFYLGNFVLQKVQMEQ